jgi:hypothetical protein
MKNVPGSTRPAVSTRMIEDDVTDERQMTVGFAKVCWSIVPAVVGCRLREKMFRVFIGYYSISL